MAHSYSHLYRLPTTGLRFFTVYGPWGRPDMAIFLFTKAIIDKQPIKLFNNGDMRRDFTYVDDVVSAISRLIGHVPVGSAEDTPARIYNVGNHKPEELLHVVQVLEKCQLREAVREKEQGLDSYGRKLHFIYTSVSGVHFGQNRKLCSSHFKNSK
jgi:UDP-glucuronate 4-epimerase